MIKYKFLPADQHCKIIMSDVDSINCPYCKQLYADNRYVADYCKLNRGLTAAFGGAECGLFDRNNLPADVGDRRRYDNDDSVNLPTDVWGGAGPDCSTERGEPAS